MTDQLFVKIDEQAFRDLVAGRTAKLSGDPVSREALTINVILEDIGWDRMLMAIHEAMVERDGRKAPP
jgi:hypothetical protein